jgi:rhodanese-related sulfurtransferase
MLARLRALFRPAPLEPNWVDAVALRRQLAGTVPPLVVDVRGPDEFTGPLGHIDGARNIPLTELPARQAEIAAGHPVVFVCLTDKRSSAAAAQFAAAGARDVSVLRGGMKAWREAE